MKKFIVFSESLKAAFKKLSQAAPKNPVLPVLSNVFVMVTPGELRMITTDLELTIIVSIACESKDSFEVLLPFDFTKRVIDLSESQPMTIEVAGRKCHMRLDSDSYDLGGLDKVKDFPALPVIQREDSVKLPEDFTKWLLRAQHLVSKDEKDGRTGKICLDFKEDALTIAATDKLAIFTRRFGLQAKEAELLISPRVAKALEGMEDIELYYSDSHICFRSDSLHVYATRFTDLFVAYRSVFPQRSGEALRLSRNDLHAALVKASLSAEPTSRTDMLLRTAEGVVRFESNDLQHERLIRSDVPAKYSGTLERISFNCHRFLNLLNQTEGDEVNLHLTSEKKAVVITVEGDEDYEGLIVPMTINE